MATSHYRFMKHQLESSLMNAGPHTNQELLQVSFGASRLTLEGEQQIIV